MITREIRISRLDDVNRVVDIASTCPLGVEAVDSRGHVADASSILGMLALNYDDPVVLRSRDESYLQRICSMVEQLHSKE